MKIADPERGFRKMREDIRKRREEQESKVKTTQTTETSHEPTNNNYNNYIPSRPVSDSDAIQSQLNNIQQQISNINRPQPQPNYYVPPAPVQQPVQQTVNKPREQVSLTGVGFITLFLTGVMAYMYQIDSFVQNNIDSLIAKLSIPITPNLIFGGIAVLGVCLIIAGIFSRRR